MSERTRLVVEYSPWSGRAPYLVRMVEFVGDGRIYHADELQMSEGKEGDVVEPFLRLDESMAQQLMDDLWRAGVRPAHAKHGDAQTDALKAHLADMQRLTFDLVGRALPARKA